MCGLRVEEVLFSHHGIMVIHVDTAGILQRILIRASIAAWHALANIYASLSCPQLSAHDHEETRVYAGSIPKVTITQNALPEKCSSQRGVFSQWWTTYKDRHRLHSSQH
jgi:hypothetical protein